MIFVNSMSDLFHKEIRKSFIASLHRSWLPMNHSGPALGILKIPLRQKSAKVVLAASQAAVCRLRLTRLFTLHRVLITFP